VNPEAPWYRADIDLHGDVHYAHGWFVAFAPADDPQIAIAVMVEYGCAGSTSAHLAKKIIDSCIEHGYLQPNSKAKVAARE
jgi:cell division protein FtsI/penicillin-binding protein 2